MAVLRSTCGELIAVGRGMSLAAAEIPVHAAGDSLPGAVPHFARESSLPPREYSQVSHRVHQQTSEAL